LKIIGIIVNQRRQTIERPKEQDHTKKPMAHNPLHRNRMYIHKPH